MAMKWYQPKWQKNDYYQYNFRINNGDGVTVKYCDMATGTTGFLKQGTGAKPMTADGSNCVWAS